MAQLVPFPFDSPGIAGLNLQARNSILGPEWATVLHNAVIDEQGRPALRAGTQLATSTSAAAAVHRVFSVLLSDGTADYYEADSAGALYSTGPTANQMTDVSGTTTVASDGNYKFAKFNGKIIASHSDGTLAVQATRTGNFADITFALHTPPAFKDILSGWGRMWGLTNDGLYWSNLLDETTWRTSGTATDAGFLSMDTVWPGGDDVGVALAEFNGNLVIFGSNSIVIYADPVDPLGSTFVKVEAIEGTGCAQRDTVQTIGRDLLWMSQDGLKTLGRVIQEKSMPLNDALPQIRDDLVAATVGVSSYKIASAYAKDLGLYVITTPDKTYAVNVKSLLQDKSFRVTTWDSFDACADNGTGGLLLVTGTGLYNYTGSLDGVAYAGTGGTSYTLEWNSGWLDFESLVQGAGPLWKYPKKLTTSVDAYSALNLQFKWTTDYKNAFETRTVQTSVSSSAALYGIAQYGLSTYGVDAGVQRKSVPGNKSGRVVKVGLAVSGSTGPVAINRFDLYAKVGKLRT